jgi:hypothetical protein
MMDKRVVVLLDAETVAWLKERSYRSQPHASVGELIRRGIRQIIAAESAVAQIPETQVEK